MQPIQGLIASINKSSLLATLKKAEEIITKENIKEILAYLEYKYMQATKEEILNTKAIESIYVINDAKQKLNANVNFDMTRDDLIIKLWETSNFPTA